MNKMFRHFRTHHARKGSLKDNLKDVFDRSAQSASPDIVSQIEASLFPKNRKHRPLPVSVKPLLLYPHLYEFEEELEETLPSFSDCDIMAFRTSKFTENYCGDLSSDSSDDEEARSGYNSSVSDDPTVSEPAESDTSLESSEPSEMEVDSE